MHGAHERNGEMPVTFDHSAELADQRLAELLEGVRLATDRVSLEAGYRGLEAWRQERPLNDHARIGGRPGMGDAILTRHGGDDLSKGILKLSCEPDEILDGGTEGTGGARVGIGLPLSTTSLGKTSASSTEKSRRPVITESRSEAEVEAWVGPILPVTVVWISQLLRLLLGILLGEWGDVGMRSGSNIQHEEDLTLCMSEASEGRVARGCHASIVESLRCLDVPGAELQAGHGPS